MSIKNDCRKNAEGYSDPTAYEALRNIEQEEERFHKLLGQHRTKKKYDIIILWISR